MTARCCYVEKVTGMYESAVKVGTKRPPDMAQDLPESAVLDAGPAVMRPGKKAQVEASVSEVLPRLLEFQKLGYNLLFPAPVDLERVRKQLAALIKSTTKPALQSLLAGLLGPAEHFLERFEVFRNDESLQVANLSDAQARISLKAKSDWDDHDPEHQMIKHGNRLAGYLSETMDLVQACNDSPAYSLSWQEKQQDTRYKLAIDLALVDTDHPRDSFATAELQGPLKGKVPENIKLNRLVNSTLFEERQARDTLGGRLIGKAQQLLPTLALTHEFAEKNRWPGLKGIAADLLAVCNALRPLVMTLMAEGKRIQPRAEKLGDKFQKTPAEIAKGKIGRATESIHPHLPVAVKSALQAVGMAAASVSDVLQKAKKNYYKLAYQVSRLASRAADPVTEALNQTFFEAGLKLSNTIQQVHFGIYQVQIAARQVQQAAQLRDDSIRRLPEAGVHATLDNALQQESARWQAKEVEATKQLQQAIVKYLPLREEKDKARYLSDLREVLQKAPQTPESRAIREAIDDHLAASVEALAVIAMDLGKTALDFSWRGTTVGRRAVDESMATSANGLSKLKAALKTSMVQATGRSLTNYSRNGMLARGMAEWSEGEKQRYLEALSDEDRVEAASEYDQLFREVFPGHLSLFEKDSDSQGRGLGERLNIERANAAQDRIIYPVTMAELLAGMKSTSLAVQNWSQKKLVRGLAALALLGPLKLGLSLVTLPVRIGIKLAVMGVKETLVYRKGEKGVRVGEGDVGDLYMAHAWQTGKVAVIKLTVSALPGVAMVIGAISLIDLVSEKGLKDAAKSIASSFLDELPWMAPDLALNASARRAVADHKDDLLASATAETEKLLIAAREEIAEIESENVDNLVSKPDLAGDDPTSLTATEVEKVLSRSRRAAPETFKEVGQINAARVAIPNGKHVELTFGDEEGGSWSVVIRIPEGKRGWPAWRDYLAEYLNTQTPLPQPLLSQPVRLKKLVEESNPLSSSEARYGILVENSSTATWAIYNFVEKPGPDSKVPFVSTSEYEYMIVDYMEEKVAVTKVADEEGETEDEDNISSEGNIHDWLGGIREVGSFVDADMNFPSGKKLYLKFVRQGGTRFSIIIDIPEDERANDDWQRYAAEYINDRPMQYGEIKIGVDRGRGFVEVDDTGSSNFIYAGADSDVTGAAWGVEPTSRVSGTDLDFPTLDTREHESFRFGVLQALNNKILAEQAEESQKELTDSQRLKMASINQRLNAVQVEIDIIEKSLESLQSAAQADSDFIKGMSISPEPVAPSGYSAIDAHAKAKAEQAHVAQKLSNVKAYQNHFDKNPRKYSGGEYTSRRAKLDSLHATLTEQLKNQEQALIPLTEAAAAEEKLSIKARNARILQESKQNTIRLLDLMSRLRDIENNLTYIWFAENRYAVKTNGGPNPRVIPTGRFSSKDFRSKSNGHSKLKEWDALEASIKSLRSRIAQSRIDHPLHEESAVDNEVETADEVGGSPAFEQNYDQRVQDIKQNINNWILEVAHNGGIGVYAYDLNKTYKVSYNELIGIGSMQKDRVATTKKFTLRQIFLGEADRYASVMRTIRDIEPAPEGSEYTTETPSQSDLNLLLRRETRLNIASYVARKVDAEINGIIEFPALKLDFKQRAMGAIYNAVHDNASLISQADPVYQDIATAYSHGYVQPSPVYVGGKAIPGVVAIGGETFKIMISVQTGKIILFDATTENLPLTGFLKAHVAGLDKNTITDSVLAPPNPRGSARFGWNLPIFANPNIRFGQEGEDVYETLLNASAGRLKSNVGGLIYAMEEADDDRKRQILQGTVEALVTVPAMIGAKLVPISSLEQVGGEATVGAITQGSVRDCAIYYWR